MPQMPYPLENALFQGEEGERALRSIEDPAERRRAERVVSAIEDELRRSAADEVLISTLPPKQSNWLEAGILERLREELDVPVTHLVAEPSLAPRA